MYIYMPLHVYEHTNMFFFRWLLILTCCYIRLDFMTVSSRCLYDCMWSCLYIHIYIYIMISLYISLSLYIYISIPIVIMMVVFT